MCVQIDLGIFNTQVLLESCCEEVKECLPFIGIPIEKEFKFICQGKECNSTSDPHYLLHSPNGIHISCERNKRGFRILTREEAYWFPVDIDAVRAEEASSSTPQGMNINKNSVVT